MGEERGGKMARKEKGKTACLERGGRIFAKRATTKVVASHDHITHLHMLRKCWQHLAKTILCQLRSISGHVVTSRNDRIGVYVITKHPYTAHCGLFLSVSSVNKYSTFIVSCGYKKFLRSVICPVRAVAATVAGLPRQ